MKIFGKPFTFKLMFLDKMLLVKKTKIKYRNFHSLVSKHFIVFPLV